MQRREALATLAAIVHPTPRPRSRKRDAAFSLAAREGNLRAVEQSNYPSLLKSMRDHDALGRFDEGYARRVARSLKASRLA